MTRSGTLRGGPPPPPQATGKPGRGSQGDIPLLYGSDPDDDDDEEEQDDGMTQIIPNAPLPGRVVGKSSSSRSAPPPPKILNVDVEETQAGLDQMGVTQMTPALRMPPRKPSLPFVPTGFGAEPAPAPPEASPSLPFVPPSSFGADPPPPEARPFPPEPPRVAPAAAPRVGDGKTRPIELLWCAEGLEPRLRRIPAVATLLGPAPAAADSPDREVARRAVHRTLARLHPEADLQKALWDAVDDDGVLTPPLVAVAGELELLTDRAADLATLCTLAHPFAEKDGELVEPLDKVAAVAQNLPDATDLLTRELASLRRAWTERDLPMPLEDLEAGARRILILKRKLRTLDVFEGPHVAALLRTEAQEVPSRSTSPKPPARTSPSKAASTPASSSTSAPARPKTRPPPWQAWCRQSPGWSGCRVSLRTRPQDGQSPTRVRYPRRIPKPLLSGTSLNFMLPENDPAMTMARSFGTRVSEDGTVVPVYLSCHNTAPVGPTAATTSSKPLARPRR